MVERLRGIRLTMAHLSGSLDVRCRGRGSCLRRESGCPVVAILDVVCENSDCTRDSNLTRRSLSKGRSSGIMVSGDALIYRLICEERWTFAGSVHAAQWREARRGDVNKSSSGGVRRWGTR